MCFSGHAGSAFSSSQHPQVQSDHKFSITDTFVTFLFLSLKQAKSLLDSGCFSFLIG